MMNQLSCDRKRGEKGATIVLFTFLIILVLIPIIGLAIDGSIVFWQKARLQASVDAAALAAGRSLSAGLTDQQQQNSASQTAQSYFIANFQPGSMGTQVVPNPDGNPSFYLNTITGSGYRQTLVEQSVSVPLSFLRILGFNSTILTAKGQASRRDVNVLLVLDRSSSMNITGPDGNNVCQTMKQSAQTFVNYFVDGRDQLGLITFHAGVRLDYPPTKYFKSSSTTLNSVIGNLVCGSNTNTATALHLAYNTLQDPAYALPNALNVIVFFTDGQPNGLTANFPVLQTGGETRYDVTPNDTNTITTVPSGCTSSVLTGAIAQWAGGAKNTGPTEGIFNPTTGSISDVSYTLVGDSGCATVKNKKGKYMRQDVAYIPLQDAYGNSTIGYMTQPSDYISNGPYTNIGFRVDVPRALVNASFNAADAQAATIRNNTTYLIYAIGLGGAADAPTEQVFQTFLTRISNDVNSPIYTPARPTGSFVYSPNSTQLAAAFRRIASQVLSISQ